MGYEYTNIRHRIILRSLLLGVFTVPFLSFANVSFTEIMYDVSGSDTGREWVEITADTATDLSDWKLFEANTNHTLTLVKGAALVPAGSFVVIADNTEKFLLDFPSFTGTLFDSSFSLSNTGETISLRNADLVDTDTVSYTSGQGAAGDGNSLQKINSVWAASLPTPGAANNTSANTNDTPPAGADSGAISTQENSKNTSWFAEPQIFADAGANRTVIVGADTFFGGKAYGAESEPILNARYLWNFGDGGEKEGQSVLYHYRYPGEYVVVLDASSGYYSGLNKIRVKAIPANLSIVSVGAVGKQFIELANGSGKELDISWWRLRAGAGTFTIPKNTFILPDTRLVFSGEVTGLSVMLGASAALLYPNGEIATTSVLAGFIPVQASSGISVGSPTRDVSYATSDVEVVAGTEKTDSNVVSDEQENQRDIVPLSVFTAAAAAGSSLGITDGTPLFKWLMALFFVTFLAIAGVVFVRRRESALVSDDKKTADEFEILEDLEDQ